MGKSTANNRAEDDNDDEDEDDEELEEEEENGDDDAEDGEKKSKSKYGDEKTFTAAQVESTVKRRLARAKRKLRSEILAEIEDDPDKKDDTTDLKNRLTTAERRVADLEELEELAEERYEQELEELPEHIRDLAPDDDADILTKERWLVDKARPAMKKYQDSQGEKKGEKKDDKGDQTRTTRRSRRGNDPKDPPANNRRDESAERKKLKEEVRGTGGYRRIL